MTSIRFPKKLKDAVGYSEILKKHKNDVVNGYGIEIVDDEIFITEQVLNVFYLN